MKITHRPKGGMCLSCKNFNPDGKCPKPVEFPWMRRIGMDKDGVVIVKCDNYESKTNQ